MTLLEQTNALLQSKVAEGLSLAEIAASSKKRVEREWLYKFAKGGIDDPSINRIQKLHDHLRSLPPR